MNSRSIIAICASIIILATLCYCVAGIYAGYAHDDIEGFDRFIVYTYGSEFTDGGWGIDIVGSTIDEYAEDYEGYKFHADLLLSTPKLHGDKWRSNRALLLGLRKWAEDNRATVLVTNLNPGIGICDYSGWLDSALDTAIVERLNNGERGVYVSDDAFFQTAYVKNGVFMPETIAIPILGTFSSTDENIDKLILERKYLYPLEMNAGSSDYTFYTRGGDAEELVEIFKEKGFVVTDVNYSDFWKPLFDQILSVEKIWDVYGKGFNISIVFCFIFTFLMYYRGIFASVKVKHRFGLSKIRLFGQTLLTALAVAAISLLLFGVYLFSDINGIQMSNLDNFIPMLAAGITALSILVSLCGYGMLVFRLNREVK